MTTITITDFQQQFADVGDRVSHEGERILVTRDGKPLFAVVPCEDAELLEALQDRMDLDLAKKALNRNDALTWAKAQKQLGL